MSVAFWSINVKPSSPVTVQPPEGYVLNVQQAALTGDAKGLVTLRANTESIEGQTLNATLCTLRPVSADQCTLQLVFGWDVPVTFEAHGDDKGGITVCGYYQPGPDDDAGEDDDEDEDDEDLGPSSVTANPTQVTDGRDEEDDEHISTDFIQVRHDFFPFVRQA